MIVFLFFTSGFAGLAYQMVWAKMFANGLGHEGPAVLAVVCAFMGGMAAGSYIWAGKLARTTKPLAWYGRLEIVVGLWAIISTVLVPSANRVANRAIGVDPPAWWHWIVAFVCPLIV